LKDWKNLSKKNNGLSPVFINRCSLRSRWNIYNNRILMVKFKVTIEWNEQTKQWRMLDSKGKALNEYFDCPRFCRKFKGANKKTPEVHRITIEWLKKA